MKSSAIATLAVAVFLGIGIASCNTAGSKGSGSESMAETPAATNEKPAPGPEDYIGNITSVTGSALPGGMSTDFSGGTHAAPTFGWTNGAGENASLEDYRGKVVMVNFWGTWCPPCRRELPDIVRLRNDLGPQGFEVIGIAIGERVPMGVSVESHLASFADANNLEYPLVVGNQDMVTKYGGISAVPTTFIVNREGKVVNMLVGGKSEAQFRQAVEAAL